MKNFNYNVNSYFADGTEMTLRTNNVRDAIEAFFENVENGVRCDIVNGFTGEVLALCGHPEGEDFATDEMALMFLGYLAEQAWGEDEDEGEEENVLVCQSCGGSIDENGNCEWCGRFFGAADVPADGVVADPIIAMLDDLVAQGKAVKLGGLPS